MDVAASKYRQFLAMKFTEVMYSNAIAEKLSIILHTTKILIEILFNLLLDPNSNSRQIDIHFNRKKICFGRDVDCIVVEDGTKSHQEFYLP